MIHNGEISETAFRVLDYWMHELPANGVKERLTSMKFEKIRAVEEVMELIDTTSCMREKLVHYFGQTLDNKVNNCCQSCGMDYKNIIRNREIKDSTSIELNWRRRIEKLLLGNS